MKSVLKVVLWLRYVKMERGQCATLMLKIMDIVARHGAEFPFPTRTLYMAGGEGDAAAQAAMQAESPRQAMSAAAAPPGSAAPSRPAPGAGAQ